MAHIHNLLTTPPIPSKTTKLFHQHLPRSLLLPLHTINLRKITRRPRITLSRKASASSIEGDLKLGDNEESESLISGSNVVRNFYDGINRRDLGSVEGLIGEACIYEDLIFPRPFVGREPILEFFGKFIDYISGDLQFVIDDISEEDSCAVGVTWHLEWKGKAFPFSKGCSFYKLAIVDGSRQIIYARDSVEPFTKPGESALVAIRGVTWLLQRFPNLIDSYIKVKTVTPNTAATRTTERGN